MPPTFPTTFEKEQQSPLTPMSTGGAANTPISYKANVNRMKTKKWADAKPADYGGDDWGDDDEYDLPPEPISKPTGLRQKGQSMQGGPSSAATPTDRKAYGILPALPGASSSRPRANSFDSDDETRNFSNATVRQPSPPEEERPGPTTRFSQITGVPSNRDASAPPALSITTQQLGQQPRNASFRKPVQAARVVSPILENSNPKISGPGRTNTGNSSTAFSGPNRVNTGESGSVYSQPTDIKTPSSDYQTRRDFSPTAVPAPLSTSRSSDSPAPQSATDTQSSARFPARKSSLSQSAGPDISEITAPTPAPIPAAASKPWVDARSSSPGTSARSPSTTTGKALPFIRPADIYRRMEEEKERERQSMDSGRPSMDSSSGAKSSDRSQSPAKPLREKSSSDSLADGRQKGSLEKDDLSASGRYMAPILEPVKERRSEYGFDGVNMGEQAAKANSTLEHQPSDSIQFEIEKVRRSSVSPKLPDLDRMSGFGFDMFGLSKSVEPKSSLPQTSDPGSNPTATPSLDAPTTRQESSGYRSVVNQSFDVPQTPASQRGSEVRRSDSESTGTTGIKPIMSGAPSGAVSDIRSREEANTSILEVVHEPSATSTPEPGIVEVSSRTTETKRTSVIEPGYRRDMRTPSPDNSPARKPLTQSVDRSQEAVKADPSSSSDDTKEGLQPHRPGAVEREESFRPSLPGGWTSYATTARSVTPQPGSSRVSKEVERAQTPTNQTIRDEKDTGLDITPTTTRHSLSHSDAPRLAAAGTSLGSAAGSAFGQHDPTESITKQASANESEKGDGPLPSPDSTIAPSGNSYAAAPLDQRLLPKLESVSPEAQLRPVPVKSNEESGEAPTPPAKDTPIIKDVDIFPRASHSTKQRTLGQVDESLAPTTRPKLLPKISTDTQVEESDMLHKEIIKSLSPRPSDATYRSELLVPDHMDEQRISDDVRYSVLPSEYGDYWATSTDGASAPPLSTSHTARDAEESVSSNTPVRPLNAPSSSVENETRPPAATRFSWETTGESVRVPHAEEDVPDVPSIPTQQVSYPDRNMSVQDVNDEIARQPSSQEHDLAYSQQANLDYDKDLGAQGLESTVSEASVDDDHTGRNAALLAGGATLGGGAAAVAAAHSHSQAQATHSPHHERSLSLAEEKDPQVNSYPVSPTPPEDEHPARASQIHLSSPLTEQQLHSVQTSSVASPTSRILAFKEIAVMKNPQQRIQIFDDTRQRFAAMDSGLLEWMSALKTQHLEHAQATGSWSGAAFPVSQGSVGAKYGKGTAPVQALQQPYYQQYLNASSSPTTAGTPVSRPSPGIPTGSQQGFSPAGGKLTTQQVQAKGKELLHTAGIFGGKAGKAGKGLFAKGKNKLRGSGAGDKTPEKKEQISKLGTLPPQQPKSERRSSWNPLSSARQSKYKISVPIATPERQRADPIRDQSSIPVTGDRYEPRMSGAVGEEPREDNVSRDQAVAVTEDDHAKSSDHSCVPDAAHSIVLTVPYAEETGAQSECSTSGDAYYYDASEDPSDANEWIMVSPAEGRDEVSKMGATSTPKPDEEIYHPPEGPPPSFLKRQQTEPVVCSETSKAAEQESVPAHFEPRAQPLAAQDEVYESPKGPPSRFLKRPQEQAARDSSATQSAATTVIESKQPPALSAIEQDVKNGASTPTSVLNRPRFSYEGPAEPQTLTRELKNASHYFPTQQNFIHGAREQQSQQAQPDDSTRNASFEVLPPIRRTSTFGLGIGHRYIIEREPLDDDEEAQIPHSHHAPHDYGSMIGAAAGAATVAAYVNHDEKIKLHQVHQTTPSTNLSQQRRSSTDVAGANRSDISPEQSSDYSQNTMRQVEQAQNMVQAPRATESPHENFRRSQDAWRPNVLAPANSSPTRAGNSISPQRPSFDRQRSLESQRHRAVSDVSQTTIRTNIQTQYNDRGSHTLSNLPMRLPPYDQPPSSAQRYPELFQSQAPSPDLGRDGELPSHMYQAPIPREATFLPRHQTNEYQLPGVGPPVKEPRPSRRNSGNIFKDLGGRISRGTSRERGGSISRDGGVASTARPVGSRGTEYADSSVSDEEGQERQKRRSSFFGALSWASITGLQPPRSRESVVAHFSRSRTDLLDSTEHSPVDDRKGSLSGRATTSAHDSKPNKISRSSTSGMMEEPGKKKRFSGLSSMFRGTGNASSSKTSLQDRPQAVRQLSHDERQPIESPQIEGRKAPKPPPAVQHGRGLSQQRQFLKKRSSSNWDPSKPREESKPRRSSVSNLLSGIMGRKDQMDRSKDDTSSQGGRSQASQPPNPQQITLGQTYSDLQDEPPQAQAGPPPQAVHQPQPTKQQQQQQQRPPQAQSQERGRRSSREPARDVTREPQYASVPIPGGYDLVRGDGTLAAPRGNNPQSLPQFPRGQQLDPRYMDQQAQGSYPHGNLKMSGYGQQPDLRTSQGIKPPALTGVESHESYTKRDTPRLSHEDLVARSAAREQPGQQRPYQLSLPEDEEHRDQRPNPPSKSPPPITPAGPVRNTQPQAQPRHDTIQPLQQPVLRHPESPAGYPLPEDSVFSPINEAASNVPPPPPPQWPSAQHRNQNHISNQHLALQNELDRSNTGRTAVSDISRLSGPQSAGLQPPGKSEGERYITPSPTPPSPAYTPERDSSPPGYSPEEEKELERGLSAAQSERGRGAAGGEYQSQRLRTTQITAQTVSPDLYSASPLLPPAGFTTNWNGHAGSASNSRDLENGPVAKRLAEERTAQEEKIYYDAETGEEPLHHEEIGVPSMSATSYPGMEWNPYIAGYQEYN